jgi:hypothetical protein
LRIYALGGGNALRLRGKKRMKVQKLYALHHDGIYTCIREAKEGGRPFDEVKKELIEYFQTYRDDFARQVNWARSLSQKTVKEHY